MQVAVTGRALRALPEGRVDGGLCPPTPPGKHSLHLDMYGKIELDTGLRILLVLFIYLAKGARLPWTPLLLLPKRICSARKTVRTKRVDLAAGAPTGLRL